MVRVDVMESSRTDLPAAASLSNLIASLERASQRDSETIKSIRDPVSLIAALKELQQMIGNTQLKMDVAAQVYHLILNKRRAADPNSHYDDPPGMLNIILSGPPGVGKTMIGNILAKIYHSLGYISGAEKKEERHFRMDTQDYSQDDLSFVIGIISLVLIFVALFSQVLWPCCSWVAGYVGWLWTLGVVGFLLLLLAIVIYWNYPQEPQSSTVEREHASNTPKTMADTPAIKELMHPVSREDFVGQYLGQTAPRTKKLLESCLGKVIFVDEAYSLINAPDDQYGLEALNTLNRFMSENAGKIIVIFAGYSDLLNAGPFAVQPGLKRRFMWQFECVGYSPSELCQIFEQKVNKIGWKLSNSEKMEAIFRENTDAFPNYAGDVERLVNFAKIEHDKDYISKGGSMQQLDVLEPAHVAMGIRKLRQNTNQDTGSTDNPASWAWRRGNGLKDLMSRLG